MTANEIRKIINASFLQNGEKPVDEFIFGKFVDAPNKRGVFQLQNSWFVYDIDEKNVKTISGPFDDKDIIYACAKLLHKSKYFENYRFSQKARETYIHSHYRSLTEAKLYMELRSYHS